MAAQSPEITEQGLKEKYEADFQPKAYANSLYQGQTNPSDSYTSDLMKFYVSFLHRVFSIDLPGGDSLLDLGCGPTIHSVVSASGHYKNIVSADYLEKNRQEVNNWIQNDANAIDWSYVLQTVASLEQETDYRKVAARLRSHMKEVIPCDVTLANPLAPLHRTFDVVVTSLCHESIATDPDSYKKIMANTANLLKPNGHLIVAGVFNCSFYIVGTERFYSFVLEKKLVDDALSEAGLEVLLFQTQSRHADDKYGADFTDTFILLAKKKN